MRTPAGVVIWMPGEKLADAIASEWRAQDQTVDLATMPLTRVAASVVDRVAPHRQEIIADIAGHGRADLVCYRAGEPAELALRQAEVWQPLVDWIEEIFGAQFVVTSGVMPVEQSAATLAALTKAVASHTDHELAALSLASGTARSLTIGLALCQGRIDAKAAHAACMLDEDYQVERWGGEPEAEKRSRFALDELELAQNFLVLLRHG